MVGAIGRREDSSKCQNLANWDVLKNLFKDEPYFDAFHMGRDSSHSPEYYKDFSEVFVPIKLIEDQRRLMTQGKGSKLMDVLVRFRLWRV